MSASGSGGPFSVISAVSDLGMKRASSYDEIKPLIALCRSGRLFDVQEWIAAGKPVNPPLQSEKGTRRKSPLEVAIEKGFHSLVQVLLEAGAETNNARYSPLEQAVSKRRLDLIELLVRHGADIHSVRMDWVFDSWEPEIMKFFIDNGADVESGFPLAYAMCQRIRTTLGIFKSYKDRFASLQEQANMALRHHCREGNLKWVSLMLWAGADPYARGPLNPDDEVDPDFDDNALELAAYYGHFEVFKLKQIRLDPKHPDSQKLLKAAGSADKTDLLHRLLEMGFDPIDQENGGSSLLQNLLKRMSWGFSWDRTRSERYLDTSNSRQRIKMIHLLARYGAKWIPTDPGEINSARRSLLKLSPDYTAEFVWIMSGYNACRREDIERLLSTPSILALVSKHLSRINELIGAFKVAASDAV